MEVHQKIQRKPLFYLTISMILLWLVMIIVIAFTNIERENHVQKAITDSIENVIRTWRKTSFELEEAFHQNKIQELSRQYYRSMHDEIMKELHDQDQVKSERKLINKARELLEMEHEKSKRKSIIDAWLVNRVNSKSSHISKEVNNTEKQTDGIEWTKTKSSRDMSNEESRTFKKNVFDFFNNFNKKAYAVPKNMHSNREQLSAFPNGTNMTYNTKNMTIINSGNNSINYLEEVKTPNQSNINNTHSPNAVLDNLSKHFTQKLNLSEGQVHRKDIFKSNILTVSNIANITSSSLLTQLMQRSISWNELGQFL